MITGKSSQKGKKQRRKLSFLLKNILNYKHRYGPQGSRTTCSYTALASRPLRSFTLMGVPTTRAAKLLPPWVKPPGWQDWAEERCRARVADKVRRYRNCVATLAKFYRDEFRCRTCGKTSAVRVAAFRLAAHLSRPLLSSRPSCRVCRRPFLSFLPEPIRVILFSYPKLSSPQ
jgi:hypothetical protein